MTREIRVGDAYIAMRVIAAEPGEEEGWLDGVVEAQWSAGHGGPRSAVPIQIGVGCFADAGKQCEEWSADLEGAAVLVAVLGGWPVVSRDTRCITACHLFPAICAELGAAVEEMLREAAGIQTA